MKINETVGCIFVLVGVIFYIYYGRKTVVSKITNILSKLPNVIGTVVSWMFFIIAGVFLCPYVIGLFIYDKIFNK